MNSKIILNSLGALIIASPVVAQDKKSQPNIVYILADDLGYGDLGCYGQKIIKTPNIDKLASQGMLFTQHYAGCTVSAPSRCSLLTGLHTGHTFIRGNKDPVSSKSIQTEGQYPLPENTFTIAKMLKEAGYITGAFGKWGLGSPGSTGDPNRQGFDKFYGYNCQGLAHNYYPFHLWDNQIKVMLDGNVGEKREQYAPDLIQNEAIHFLNENKSKKFFMYLAYTLPHAELTSPDDSIYAMYNRKIETGKPYIENLKQGGGFKNGSYCTSLNPHADFAAMITRLDAYVGQVVNELKKLGLDKNTLIIFTSDNGPHREGGGDPDFFDSYGPLRGIKRDVYEGGIRVPMIASFPGKIKKGSKSNYMSAFWDIMPTFKELSNSKAAIETDGISILPTLFSKNNQKEHKYLYWEFHENGGKIAVRMGKWKGIKLNYGKNPTADMLLFDLSTDIHEDNNIAAKNPKIVEELENIIKSARVNSEVFKFDTSKASGLN